MDMIKSVIFLSVVSNLSLSPGNPPVAESEGQGFDLATHTLQLL